MIYELIINSYFIFNHKIDYGDFLIIFKNSNNMIDFEYLFKYFVLNSIFYYHRILTKSLILDFMTFTFDIFMYDLNYSQLIHKIYYILIK